MATKCVLVIGLDRLTSTSCTKTLSEFSQLCTACSAQITPHWPSTEVCKQFLFTLIFLCSTGAGHLDMPKLKLTSNKSFFGHNVRPPCLSVTVRSCLCPHWRLEFQWAETTLSNEVMRLKWNKVNRITEIVACLLTATRDLYMCHHLKYRKQAKWMLSSTI